MIDALDAVAYSFVFDKSLIGVWLWNRHVKIDTPWLGCCTHGRFRGCWTTSTGARVQARKANASSAFWTFSVSKTSAATRSNSCASITRTRSCTASSITTCSPWNKSCIWPKRSSFRTSLSLIIRRAWSSSRSRRVASSNCFQSSVTCPKAATCPTSIICIPISKLIPISLKVFDSSGPFFRVTRKFNDVQFSGDDRRFWDKEFGIKHYAGSVMYDVNGFVDKNRDVHQEVFLDLLNSSNQTLVQDLTSMVIQVYSAVVGL